MPKRAAIVLGFVRSEDDARVIGVTVSLDLKPAVLACAIYWRPDAPV